MLMETLFLITISIKYIYAFWQPDCTHSLSSPSLHYPHCSVSTRSTCRTPWPICTHSHHSVIHLFYTIFYASIFACSKGGSGAGLCKAPWDNFMFWRYINKIVLNLAEHWMNERKWKEMSLLCIYIMDDIHLLFAEHLIKVGQIRPLPRRTSLSRGLTF